MGPRSFAAASTMAWHASKLSTEASVGDGLAAQPLDGGHGLPGGRFVPAVVHGDVGAVLGEGDGDGAADAAAASTDERDASR